MERLFFKMRPWFLALVLLGAAASLSGCATSDPDNASVRPWNTPKGWETGLPSMMNEGR